MNIHVQLAEPYSSVTEPAGCWACRSTVLMVRQAHQPDGASLWVFGHWAYSSVTELVEVTVRIVPLILSKHRSDTKCCFDRLSNRC